MHGLTNLKFVLKHLFVELEHVTDSNTSHMTNFSFDLQIQYQPKLLIQPGLKITKPKIREHTYGISDNSNLTACHHHGH